MFEKSLHTANIAAALSALATAADVTFAGGVATMTGVALSGHSIFKDLDQKPRRIARDMARTLENSHLTPERKATTARLLAAHYPSETDLTAGNMNAATIAANLGKTIAADAQAVQDYRDMLTIMLEPHLAAANMAEEMLQELLRRTDQSGAGDRLRDEGITEKAIIRLAQRIARDIEDVGQALLELQNAMDIAVRVQQDGKTGSNHEGFVDEVLRRVAAHAAEGEYDRAALETDEALERLDAEKDRVLQQGIEVALVAGDTARAARLLVSKADLDAGGVAEFETLCALQYALCGQGRDKGLHQTLELAIDLGSIVIGRAQHPDQRGAAWGNKAISLSILGQRELGTERLEESVSTFLVALDQFRRDRAPQYWAKTQMNLANALAILGEREIGTQRLEQAVTAFKAALEELTRDDVPLEWAKTQMNLGNVLQRIGVRETGKERLEQAVSAFRAALEEFTQDRAPLEWARTQTNMANALATLGERETGTERLEQAAAAHQAALQERSLDRGPFEWAMTQHSLSGVELSFFRKTGEPSRLDAARMYALNAKKVYEEAQAEHYIQWIEGRLAEIDAAG